MFLDFMLLDDGYDNIGPQSGSGSDKGSYAITGGHSLPFSNRYSGAISAPLAQKIVPYFLTSLGFLPNGHYFTLMVIQSIYCFKGFNIMLLL